MAMATQQFPEWEFTSETWLLTCFFHDIGTVDKHTHGTLMSFEFFGGMLAHNVLKEKNAPAEQAEAVCEAIIRHQDSAEIGTITTLGLLVQIATQYGKLHPFRRPAAYRRNIN
jgi:cyanamide hydratase